jgi:hypothetical protein
MSLLTDQFAQKLSGAAGYVKDTLARKFGPDLQIVIVAFNDQELRSAGTVDRDRMREVLLEAAGEAAP